MNQQLQGAGTAWVQDRQFGTLVSWIIVFSYAWVVMPTGLQWSLILESAPADGTVGPWFKVQWMPLFLLASGLLLRRFRLLTLLLAYVNPYLLLAYAWIFLSALWAPDPAMVVRQAIVSFGILMIGLAQAVTAWHPDRLEALLRWTLTGICVASAIVALAMPQVGVHQSEQFELKNSWRGITFTKFYLGHVSEFSALLWGHALLMRRTDARLAWLAVLFSIFVLIKSRCNTSFLVLMVGFSIMIFVLRPPIRMGQLRLPVILFLALLLLTPLLGYMVFVGKITYAGLMTPVAEAFGKDISISGRTYIWEEVWKSITANSRNFWIGVGFVSFWNGPGSLADEAYRRLKWLSPDGHNGYLDIWNELGLIGLVLLLCFLVRHGWQLRQLATASRQSYALHLAIFVMILIENLTNSGFLRPISAPYILLTYSSVALSRLLFEQKLQGFRSAAARPLAAASGDGMRLVASAPP